VNWFTVAPQIAVAPDRAIGCLNLAVFARTGEAFGQLPPGALDWLLAEEGRKPLEVVIQSHIVAGAAILAVDLLGRAVEVATLGGGTLLIDGTPGVILSRKPWQLFKRR
jgi:uncharacterized surface protein with fasciclin (FAS1) repeats